jgi:hypothetical protein
MIEEIREVIGRITILAKLNEFMYQSKNKWEFYFPIIIFPVTILCSLANSLFFNNDPFLSGIIWGLIIAVLVFDILMMMFHFKMGKVIDKTFKRINGVKIKVLENGEVKEI